MHDFDLIRRAHEERPIISDADRASHARGSRPAARAPGHERDSSPLRPRPLRRLPAGRAGHARGRPHLLRCRAAGNGGDRRRVRVGEVGVGPLGPEAPALSGGASPLGQHSLQGPRPDARLRERDAAGAGRRHHHGVPGADELAQPAAHDRAAGRRDREAAPQAVGAGGARAHARDARPRRPARCGAPPRRLSAPALGRAAPARHDRDGARERARPVHRRRADDGARRHRAGADPEAPRRNESAPRHGDAVHHPRPRHRPQDRRPGLRHDARQDRRAGSGCRGVRAPAPCLHAKAARRRA